MVAATAKAVVNFLLDAMKSHFSSIDERFGLVRCSSREQTDELAGPNVPVGVT
jgi:hypothetical protein